MPQGSRGCLGVLYFSIQEAERPPVRGQEPGLRGPAQQTGDVGEELKDSGQAEAQETAARPPGEVGSRLHGDDLPLAARVVSL